MNYKLVATKIWIAIRFVVFGIFGFYVMIVAFAALVERHIDGERGFWVPIGLTMVCGIGAIMMLFGTGCWGRWGYVLVFLSIPASMLLLFLIPGDVGKDLTPGHS